MHGNMESVEGRYIQIFMLPMSVTWVNVWKKTKAKGFELLTEAKVTKMRFQTIKRKKSHPKRPSFF